MGPNKWRGHCTTLLNSTGKNWARSGFFFCCCCLRPILSILYTHKHKHTHTRQTHIYVTHTRTHPASASTPTPTPTQPPPLRLRNLAHFVLATLEVSELFSLLILAPVSSSNIDNILMGSGHSHTHTHVHTLSRPCTVWLANWASFFIYADNNKQQNCVSKHKRKISHLHFWKKKRPNQTV